MVRSFHSAYIRRHASDDHLQDNLVFEARKKSSTKQKKVCQWNLCVGM